MRFKLRFSKRVVRDIEQVLAHTLAQFGERQHEEYKTLIRQAMVDITNDPLGPSAMHRPELHPDARTFHIGRRGKRARHFFVYRVVGDEFIDLGRMLHDSMDLPRHLPKGF